VVCERSVDAGDGGLDQPFDYNRTVMCGLLSHDLNPLDAMPIPMTRQGDLLANQIVPPDASPLDRGGWINAIADAFSDRQRTSDFLPLAEQALRAYPGDAVVLCPPPRRHCSMSALIEPWSF
jgi:hypothetical protein